MLRNTISERHAPRAVEARAASWPGQIPWPYTVGELWADGIVHGIGCVLSLLGAVLFLVLCPNLSPPLGAAVALYLATLSVSMACSAAYNLWPVSRAKWVLRRFDHSAVYLLIAGTYTPFMARLGDGVLLAGVWSVALFGAAVKLGWPGRFDRLSIGLYLLLGWSGLAVIGRMIEGLPPLAMTLLLLGGFVYSAGVIFHLWERLKFQNAIWHGFVVAAATVHYGAVWAAVCVPTI